MSRWGRRGMRRGRVRLVLAVSGRVRVGVGWSALVKGSRVGSFWLLRTRALALRNSGSLSVTSAIAAPDIEEGGCERAKKVAALKRLSTAFAAMTTMQHLFTATCLGLFRCYGCYFYHYYYRETMKRDVNGFLFLDRERNGKLQGTLP